MRQFFETGTTAGIDAQHSGKLRLRLAVLHQAEEIADLKLPGYHLHPLKGDREGQWAITVTGNWQVTFEFRDGDAYVVNYEDYH